MAKAGADVIDTLRAYKSASGMCTSRTMVEAKRRVTPAMSRSAMASSTTQAIFGILDEIRLQGWVTVELAWGTPQTAADHPREAAAMSKRYLEGLLGQNASW